MYILNHIHVGPTFNGPSLCTRAVDPTSMSGSGGTPPKKPKAPVAPKKKPKK